MVAERVMSRGEILDALNALRLKPTWLAAQIGTTRQNVYNWLDGKAEPADPSVWERMSEAIAAMGRPKTTIPEDIRSLGIARRLAKQLVRELSQPYGSQNRKRES